MPFEKVDINQIKLDQPQAPSGGGFSPVDINQIKMDQPVTPPAAQPRTWAGYAADVAENVPRMALQGATLGFGEEASAGLGALAKSAMTGQPMRPEYERQLAYQRGKIEEARQENPILAPVSELGGAIATVAPAGATRAGAAIGGWASRGLLPQAQSLAGRAANLFSKGVVGGATGAAGGAAYGAGTATEGQRAEGARQGAVFGGAVGAALPVAGAAASGAISAVAPKVDEGLQAVAELAQKYKIPVSVDQLTASKPIKTMQKVSQELPFSGVGGFRDTQLSAFNRALGKTIGVESDKITPEVMDKAFVEVGKQFDSLGKGKTFQIPETFKSQIDEIMQDAQITAKKDAIENFNKGLERIYANVADDGTISGERLSLLRQEMNRLSRKASDPDTQELLKDLEGAVIDIMTAGDDVAKGVLSDAKQKYKNLIVLEPIAQKQVGGNISPTLLANRVAKVYGRQYTRGKAGEIGDLARVGKELLPELGGSDTTQKLTAIGAIGTGIIEPTTTAAVIGGNRAMQKLLNQNQKLVDKIINKGKAKQLNPAAPKAGATGGDIGSKAQYVTLPDGTVIPRVTVRPMKPVEKGK